MIHFVIYSCLIMIPNVFTVTHNLSVCLCLQTRARLSDPRYLNPDAPVALNSTNSSTHTFPLGWTPESASREVRIQTDGAALASGGLQWNLSVQSTDGATSPSATTLLRVVPLGASVCDVFLLGGSTCLHSGPVPQLVGTVGRHAQVVPGGPDIFVCLAELVVYVEAIPYTQTSVHDLMSSTAGFTRKTFSLAVKGVNTTVQPAVALSGTWQQPDGPECAGCVNVSSCPPFTVVTRINKQTFGVAEVLQRKEHWAKWGPSLLASCLSIATLAMLTYNLVGDTLTARWKVREWARLASALTPGAANREVAERALINSETKNPSDQVASDGRFTMWVEGDAPFLVRMLCSTQAATQAPSSPLFELVLEIQGDIVTIRNAVSNEQLGVYSPKPRSRVDGVVDAAIVCLSCSFGGRSVVQVALAAALTELKDGDVVWLDTYVPLSQRASAPNAAKNILAAMDNPLFDIRDPNTVGEIESDV
jgi:hypothetical protein